MIVRLVDLEKLPLNSFELCLTLSQAGGNMDGADWVGGKARAAPRQAALYG